MKDFTYWETLFRQSFGSHPFWRCAVGTPLENDLPVRAANMVAERYMEEARLASQRGARMQLMRDFMLFSNWVDFVKQHPEAENWFDESGVPVR